MNLIALVEVVDLVLSYLDSTWRRCARMIGSRNLNVAYILVLVVLSSWLLLASLTRIPRIISLQPCHGHGHIHTINDGMVEHKTPWAWNIIAVDVVHIESLFAAGIPIPWFFWMTSVGVLHLKNGIWINSQIVNRMMFLLFYLNCSLGWIDQICVMEIIFFARHSVAYIS